MLDYLKRERRVSITGGAGTGKTVLALDKAKRLATEGFNVLLTCFNRPLADHLRRCAGGAERLTIGSFHQVCWQFAHMAGVPLPEAGASTLPPDFFTTTLPDAMLEALTRVPDRFDAIVVDEGQDFAESWWAPLLLALADTERGVLYVFHDDNQQVYRRVPSFPPNLVEISLNENLRNTRRIHAATSRFYSGEPLHAVGPEGRDVQCIMVASAAEIDEAVGKVLHRLVAKEHIAPRDIAVLVGTGHREGHNPEATTIGTVPVTRNQVAEPDKVLVESTRRFKGLERQVIVLTGIDDLPPEDEKGLLYVGLSRARAYLVIVATAATFERIGVH